MRLRLLVQILGMVAVGLTLSYFSARWSVGAIETVSKRQVEHSFAEDAITWAQVETDGLQVFVIGTAESEADRFYAITSASKVVDAARVIDQIAIVDAASLTPTDYALELLRNQSGVTIVGLIPASLDKNALLARLAEATGGAEVHPLLDQANHVVDPLWLDALDFGIRAIAAYPRAKVSIRTDMVSLQATAQNEQQREKGLRNLRSFAPDGIEVSYDVNAPRPVISPFALRAVFDAEGYRFDTCSAPDAGTQKMLIDTAGAYGLSTETVCNVGLGMPLETWPKAALAAITALGEMGPGTITILDTDISLFADESVSAEKYDWALQTLKANLPASMELKAEHMIVQKPKVSSTQLVLSIEVPAVGQSMISGPVSSTLERDMAQSLALAAFGRDGFTADFEIVPDVPKDWTPRVLAAIKASGQLQQGRVHLTLADLEITGQSELADPAQTLAQIIQSTVGASIAYNLNVDRIITLVEDPSLLPPQDCVAAIKEAMNGRKINFEPGSARVNAEARAILDDIAQTLKTCEKGIALQINGYTDSQGRAEMNKALSQKRAETVMRELRIRRILTKSFAATGFGETNPIADNATEAGREANRRIEFSLQAPAEDASAPEGESNG